MPKDANFSFMARHLLAGELPGATEDIPGGVYAWREELWLGLWDAEVAGDPEAVITAAQAKSAERGVKLGGAVLLIEPAAESDPAVTALSDALFVYGFPPSVGLYPEIVQVMARTPDASKVAGLAIGRLSGGFELPAEILAGSEADINEMRRAEYDGDLSVLTNLGAMLDGEAVGLATLGGSPLVGRITKLWVSEAHRKQGIGQALLGAVAKASQDNGQIALSAWTRRSGNVRYFFARQHFSDQLRALYFAAE